MPRDQAEKKRKRGWDGKVEGKDGRAPGDDADAEAPQSGTALAQMARTVAVAKRMKVEKKVADTAL